MVVTLLIIFVGGAPLIAWMFDDMSLAPLIALCGLAAMTSGVQTLLQAAGTGLSATLPTALSVGIWGLGRLLLVGAGALVAGLAGAIFGFGLVPLLAAAPFIFVFARAWRMQRPDLAPLPRLGVRSAAAPALLAVGTNLLLVVDVFAAKRWADGPMVGAYSATSTLAHVPYFILAAAALVIIPRVVSTPEGDERRAVMSATLGESAALLLMPTMALCIVGGPVLTGVFGEQYADGVSLITPLALATFGITMASIGAMLDLALGRRRRVAAHVVFGVTVFVIPVAVAMARSGVESGARACAIMGAVICVAQIVRTIRADRLLLPWRALAWASGATLATVPVFRAVANASLSMIVVVGIVVSAAYAIVLVRARVLVLPGKSSEMSGRGADG
jgi:O-antigen/teichoic acid export membrane protein